MLCFLTWEFAVIWRLCSSQGGEEEEEGEHFSDDEASRPAVEPKPAADAPTELGEAELGEVEERDEEVKEVKTDEKGNLAGERQSGDGQVWKNRTLHLFLGLGGISGLYNINKRYSMRQYR